MRVLVVEDHHGQLLANRVALAERLGAANVEAASSLAAGQAKLSQTSFDYLLCDWHLDGELTASALVQGFRASSPDAVCVVYSSDQSAQDAALQAGATRFLCKQDVSLAEIIAALLESTGQDPLASPT